MNVIHRLVRTQRHAAAVLPAAGSLVALAMCSFGAAPVRGDEPLEYGAVATATRASRAPQHASASVSLLASDQIANHPTLTADALIRSLPSAATFRRSASLVADPSSQGLNLRGIGPSGVSRALVLVDDVPVNDPFGGWVYWRALPRLGLERVELVGGGASALYGSGALGGVLSLIPRPITRASVDADASYGSFRTAMLAARVAQRWERASGAVEGEWLRSDGYPVVAPAQRGPIDGDTPSMHGTINARLHVRASSRLRITTSLGAFRERQNGGTRLTEAQVGLLHAAVRAEQRAGAVGSFELTLYGRLQRFEQTRARISEGRQSEQLAARQDVPASAQGGSFLWRSLELELGGKHELVAGADARHVSGTSRERIFPAVPMAGSLTRREAGGEQWLVGAFVEDLYTPVPWLQLDAALRLDTWRNVHGERAQSYLDGTSDQVAFRTRTEQAVTPRGGVLVRPLDVLSLRASAYRAFRAPTLNELYRPFQVGTILTASNERLKAETLTGAEAGFELTLHESCSLRATGFWNMLEDPVTNRTLTEPLPNGAQRQRQNLGRARIRGLEAELSFRWSSQFSAVLAYTLADARVTQAGSASELRGKRLAQDPVHRGSMLITFADPSLFAATLQVRASSFQYEDDMNTLRMSGYAVVDLLISRRLFWCIELFAAAENLLNARYLVGRAGVDTIGAPLFVRAGLRMRADVL